MTTSEPSHVPAGSSPVARGRARWRGVVLENLAVLVVFAVSGAAAGWAWERWATPPDGLVLDGRWNLGLAVDAGALVNDPDSFTRAFSVVGTFVVVCAVVGLVLGVVSALACRRSELVTLATVAASSALAAYLCYRVGLTLGPADPTGAAADAADGTMLLGDLAIDQLTPFLALPVAALTGLAVTYFLTAGVSAGVEEASRVGLPREGHRPDDRPDHPVDPGAPRHVAG